VIVACSIITGRQLAAARVLAESFFAHHPDGSFTVLVVDDEGREIALDEEIDRRISWSRLADLGLDTAEIHRLAAIYDASELSTAVKPLLLTVVMRTRGSGALYLDPDGRVFDSLADAARIAGRYGIALTPQITEPIPDDGRSIDARSMFTAGMYNLGFVAVAPSAAPCLEWWWQQARRRALDGVPPQQTLTDQRATDYIPSLFDHHLLKDPGCSAAYWNLHERPLTRVDGRVLARNVPLRFFQFSGFDPRTPWLLSRHQGERPRIVTGEHPVVAALCADYAAALERAGFTASSQRRYGWDVSASGIEMSRQIRRLYYAALAAAERGGAAEPPDPFDPSRAEAFTAWLHARVGRSSAAPPLTWMKARQAEDVRVPTRATRLTPATWSDRTVAFLIGLCCLVVYNANGRVIASGDTFAARYQPFALLLRHTLLLDPVEALASQGREPPTNRLEQPPGAAYWIVPTPDGHAVSLYPQVVPVLVAPLYLPAVTYVSFQGWTDQRVDVAARIMEKLAASIVTALSASLLFLALRRRTTMSNAVLLTVAYAFGTSTWVISSQALWQHGVAQLLLTGAILLLTGPYSVASALTVGVVLGLIVGNRVPDGPLAAALGVYALVWAGRRAAIVVAAAVVPTLLVLLYNFAITGTLTGGYQMAGPASMFFRLEMGAGLAGLLFSPTRGLFVFSPFLLFLALAWRHAPHDRAERRLTLAVTAGLIVQLLAYSLTDWRAGMAWGTRFLTDMMPMLVWLLVPVVAALGRRGRACFVTAVCVAIAIEAVGAFTYTSVTDVPIFAVANGPNRLRAAWEWRNAPFIASLSHGVAPPELLHPMRGSLDVVEVNGRDTDTIQIGQNVVVKGWALAGRATPLQVALAIDGRVVETAVARTFFDRPDVRGVFPDTEPAGWEIPLETAGLDPGLHHLSLHVWGSLKGQSYFLARRTLTVQAKEGDLEAGARAAAARIRLRQQAPGYWLTAFTSASRFEQPHQEMNTYLTSLLVDLLDPLPAAAGLADGVQRARRHLTAQIEANGLVRYHGRPDSPVIGTLGCAITPDTDDTALVWRIAPAQDRQRLSAALTTLNDYRTSDGLYRTWLAPRTAYQCLDPGSDPNPADVAIQMHLLQLLLGEQPAAGRALCDALGRRIDDDRIWVYYKGMPLVPMLRTRDLERAGCPLTLPASRMQTAVPGQEIWISVVRLLLRATETGRPPPDAAEVAAVLRTLAFDDFALVRRNPPLLYHNDLTAKVPRYYWSQDVGYALWLRLAHVTGQLGRVQ
jgi:hypothetical protein